MDLSCRLQCINCGYFSNQWTTKRMYVSGCPKCNSTGRRVMVYGEYDMMNEKQLAIFRSEMRKRLKKNIITRFKNWVERLWSMG